MNIVDRQGVRPRRTALAALALVAAIALAACGDDSDDGGDGKLTFYSGRDEEFVVPLFDRFEEETGTEVEVRYGDSAELAATIVEEGANSPADVFFSQDAGSLGALQSKGLMAELPEDVLRNVDPRFRSAEGRWVGISGRARVVGYNTDQVAEDELPDSILGFTDPEWKGRIGWAPTNASFQAFVTAMRLTDGEEATREWLEGMVANEPEEFADNETVRDAIASEEIDIGFINHYYVAQAREEEGSDYPVDVDFPPRGDVGSLVNVAGVGILESSENPDRATEFAEFLLSPEIQEDFARELKEYPLVAGVEADPLLVPLDQIDQPDVDLSNLDDLEGTLALLQESGAL